MSAYYPPGSMAGSGIYATVQPHDAECDHVDEDTNTPCTWAGNVDLHVDDFGHAGWQCPKCTTDHNIEEEWL